MIYKLEYQDDDCTETFEANEPYEITQEVSRLIKEENIKFSTMKVYKQVNLLVDLDVKISEVRCKK
jgi:putative IMPACT (imprinted ancient) family translation regulator